MRIVNSRLDMLDSLTELVGIKSGLVLSRENIMEFLEQTFEGVNEITFVLGGSSKWWNGDPDDMVLVRAEEFEANFILVMYRIGAIPDCRVPYSLLIDYIRKNANKLGINSNSLEAINKTAIDFVNRMIRGEEIEGAEDFYIDYQRRDIMDYNMPIQREWDGLISLNDLFGSEDIPANTSPDCYFDQRYIDYLNAQPEEVEKIHWRQFEFLTGEYFRRHGYRVEITPPRGDGGIDVIAKRVNEVSGPDLVLIQCRRYAKDHPLTPDEIRAFWAVVDENDATKGLIVTTSRITEGGQRFINARKYRFSAIEGGNVRKWIASLSSRQVQ
jgi:restriction system protein